MRKDDRYEKTADFDHRKRAMTFICTAERFPEADDTLVSEGGLQIFPGGKGLNAALCCARLGADAVLCTRAGNDVYAKRIAEFCAKDSIDTRFVFFDSDNKTDLVQVFRAPGEACGRTIVFPGAGAALSPDNVEEAFTCYPDGVYICGETAAENTYFAVSKAKEQKIPVFLNLTDLPSDFDPHSVGVCEVLLPDEEQTEKLTGVAPTGAGPMHFVPPSSFHLSFTTNMWSYGSENAVFLSTTGCTGK